MNTFNYLGMAYAYDIFLLHTDTHIHRNIELRRKLVDRYLAGMEFPF